MCIYAEKYIEDQDMAKDLVQELFLKLWELFEDFNSEIAIRAYLYKSIRNATINFLEHQKVADKYLKRKIVEIRNEKNFLSQVIEKETHRIIHQAIEELPDKRKKIILLSIQGKTNPEIAKELDISVNTVKTQKADAYKQLRKSLENIYNLLSHIIIG